MFFLEKNTYLRLHTGMNYETTLQTLMLLLHFIKSLKCDNIHRLYSWMLEKTQLHDINFVTCSKAEIEPILRKIYPSPAFHKINKRDNIYCVYG